MVKPELVVAASITTVVMTMISLTTIIALAATPTPVIIQRQLLVQLPFIASLVPP